MNKRIANVVFYKFYGEQGVMQQACIFYEDGSVKNVSHEEGITAAHELAVSKKIKSKNEFTSEMLNKRNVYTLTGEEFERRFKEFLGKGVSVPSTESRNQTSIVPVQDNITRTPIQIPATISSKVEERIPTPEVPAQQNNLQPVAPVVIPSAPVIPNQTADEQTRNIRQVGASATPVAPVVIPSAPVIPNPAADEQTRNIKQAGVSSVPVTPVVIPAVEKNDKQVAPATHQKQTQASQSDAKPVQNVAPVVPSVVKPTSSTQTSTKGQKVPASVPVTPVKSTTTQATPTTNQGGNMSKENIDNKPKKKGLFSKLWAKVTAIALAVSLALGGAFALGRSTKSGNILQNNISTNLNDEDIEEQDRAYLELLNRSTNEDQKNAMIYMSENLDRFNRDFADYYVEEGKGIRAALTWDEMMALNLAYNTYTKDQIAIMFNGSEVNAEAMSQAYKNATLQLMGAYVIADRDHPVNSAAFVNNEYERKFVENYEDLLLRCKETTGEEQVSAINAFYAQLYKDFPIGDDVREIGISHSDARQQLEPYKTAVTPMVAAMEIMFQNTKGVDHTLSDKAIDYFNDLGLCNLVDSKFERAQAITLAAQTDTTQPLYEEFRNAKITELIYEGNYPTDDAHRDLTQLDAFQHWVNGHHDVIGKNPAAVQQQTTQTVVTPTTTTTTTTTKTETIETSDRDKAVELVGEEAVKKAEEKVDQQIDKENEAAKEEGKKEAEKVRQELQRQADKETERLEEIIKRDEANLDKVLDKANDIIKAGGTVNERDLGHGIDFDEDHSDENGNLDDSVKDITTDGKGAVHGDAPLPDPNKTGAEFDRHSEYMPIDGSGDDVPAVIYESTYTTHNSSLPESTVQPETPEYMEGTVQPETPEYMEGTVQLETPEGMEGTVYEFDPSMLDGYTVDPSASGDAGIRLVPTAQADQILDGSVQTNEELVDAYIAELEKGAQAEEAPQYSK